jgi:hypothetical protein
MASFDPVAMDSFAARLMDIPLENVGYLNYLAAAGMGNIDRNKIDIIGGKDPDKSVITYKLPNNIKTQLEWKDPLTLPQPNRPPTQPPSTPGGPAQQQQKNYPE